MTVLKNYIRRYTTIAAMMDILYRKKLPLLNPENWDDRNDRYNMKLYKEAKNVQGLYAICAARCSETYHHWRVFTSAADGVCLEIRLDNLEKLLDSHKNVRRGNVEYLLLDDLGKLTSGNVEKLPFMKRQGFSAENEYRIILESDDAQTVSHSIDIPLSIINRIHINPWLPSSLAETIRSIIGKVDGCENIKVVRSHLIDSSQWKDAGDRVVGLKSVRKPRLKRAP